MTERDVFRQILEAKSYFGRECSKFSGAIAVEYLRQALMRHGVPVSHRDVFIKGVPIEFDLVIPRADANPKLDVLYEPSEVRAVIEVKASGIVGKPGRDRICATFAALQEASSRIKCIYVAITERDGYRWAARDQDLNPSKRSDGPRAFNLLRYSGNRKDSAEPTGDWKNLLDFLHQLVAREETVCSRQ